MYHYVYEICPTWYTYVPIRSQRGKGEYHSVKSKGENNLRPILYSAGSMLNICCYSCRPLILKLASMAL